MKKSSQKVSSKRAERCKTFRKDRRGSAEQGDWSRRRLIDATEGAAAQPWLPMECHQLSAGRYTGLIRSAAIGGLNIANETHDQTVHKFGITPPDTCTVSVVLQPSLSGCFNQLDLTTTSAVYFMPAATEFDAVVPGNIETWYVTFSQTELLHRARLLDERLWPDEPRAVREFNTPARPLFTNTLASMLYLVEQSAAQTRLLGDDGLRRTLMDNVLLSLNQTRSPGSGETPTLRARHQASRVIKKAREYTEACFEADSCPSIVDICGHVGVSERALQYGFRSLMQMTPVTYLRIMRLNRVRTALRDQCADSTSVTATATQWGFLHLGRFARDYQRMFHEKPSETLGKGLA